MAATVTLERGKRDRSPTPDLRQRHASPSYPSLPWSDCLLALLLGVASLLVYARTLYPSIAWGDSAELTAAAYQAGVPHPTGYPLYMLLGHAFSRYLPLGSPAYSMNLLSALCAAVAVALSYAFMVRISRFRPGSIAAALMLAFSQTFWSQAVRAEVYAFHMVLVTALLGAFLTWEARGERRWLWASAALFGFSLTHHLMSMLLAPGLLFFALTSPHRPQFVRELPRALLISLLPLSLYLYLPLAAWRDPAMNWGDPRSWENLLAHVTGKEYHVGMFRLKGAQYWQSLQAYAGSGGFLLAQFKAGFLWLAPVGMGSLARRQPRLLVLTLLIYLFTVGYALNYLIYDIEVYYLPSHLMVAVWIACGLHQLACCVDLLLRKAARPPSQIRLLKLALGLGLLALPITLLRQDWQRNDHRGDYSALVYARALLEGLKPNALLLGADDNFQFPVMYARYVENRRTDVAMFNLHHISRPECLRLLTRLAPDGVAVRLPAGEKAAWGQRAYRGLLENLIADNIGRRPVYMLMASGSLQVPWLAATITPYHQVVTSNAPATELRRLPPEIGTSAPRPQQPAQIGFGSQASEGAVENDLEFAGYDLEPYSRGGLPWLRVSYHWRVHNPEVARRAVVWVLFTDENGNYQKMPDGSPEFHNVHPFAYGLGQRTNLPPTLKETFDLYVPPRQWRKPLRMRLAVAVDGKLLHTTDGQSQWVELTELPAFSGPALR